MHCSQPFRSSPHITDILPTPSRSKAALIALLAIVPLLTLTGAAPARSVTGDDRRIRTLNEVESQVQWQVQPEEPDIMQHGAAAVVGSVSHHSAQFDAC
jgi:hypothetical protein